MNGESALRHPLVTRYLTELESLLGGLHPAERAEVLTGVGEHLEESLAGSGGSDVAVRSALDELGPATAVADAAYDGRGQVVRPAAPPAAPVTPRVRVVPATSRSWVPPLVVVFLTLSLFLSAGVLFSTLEGTGYVELLVTAVLPSFPFWVPALVLTLVSALWTGGEKVLLVALLPGFTVGVPFLVDLLPFGSDPVVGLTVFALAVVAAFAVLVVMTRRAAHRADVLVG